MNSRELVWVSKRFIFYFIFSPEIFNTICSKLIFIEFIIAALNKTPLHQIGAGETGRKMTGRKDENLAVGLKYFGSTLGQSQRMKHQTEGEVRG